MFQADDWGREQEFTDEFEFEDFSIDKSFPYEATSSYGGDPYNNTTNNAYYEFSNAQLQEQTQRANDRFNFAPPTQQNYYQSEPASTGLFNFGFFSTPVKQEHDYQPNTFSSHFTHPAPSYTEFTQPPPEKKVRVSNTLDRNLSALAQEEIDIVIDGQPPGEVRTRTPSEVRTFAVSAKVIGRWKDLEASSMRVSLCYGSTDNSPAEPIKKDILGGTKMMPLLADGTVVFDNLWISESSTKHKEREFCIEFTLIRKSGQELLKKCTKSFYAYSHKKVLQRRGNVKLRTLSKSYGKFSGGEQMHAIGTPFIQGPALSLIFKTPHGDVIVKDLEYYSDSVLFFDLPPYPLPEGAVISPDAEVKVQVVLTNDGRTYSNALDFTFMTDSTPRSRI